MIHTHILRAVFKNEGRNLKKNIDQSPPPGPFIKKMQVNVFKLVDK